MCRRESARYSNVGTGAGFWHVMRLDPDRDLGVVVMTNSTTTYDFASLFTR